jgi:two-component system sensor histidine kinase/response regulator
LRSLPRLRPGAFDAILMDIRMPVMNGYEATRAIRSMERPDSKTIPIIAMTADAFEEDLRRAKDAGMDDYLIKPINANKVYSALSNAYLTPLGEQVHIEI